MIKLGSFFISVMKSTYPFLVSNVPVGIGVPLPDLKRALKMGT